MPAKSFRISVTGSDISIEVSEPGEPAGDVGGRVGSTPTAADLKGNAATPGGDTKYIEAKKEAKKVTEAFEDVFFKEDLSEDIVMDGNREDLQRALLKKMDKHGGQWVHFAMVKKECKFWSVGEIRTVLEEMGDGELEHCFTENGGIEFSRRRKGKKSCGAGKRLPPGKLPQGYATAAAAIFRGQAEAGIGQIRGTAGNAGVPRELYQLGRHPQQPSGGGNAGCYVDDFCPLRHSGGGSSSSGGGNVH